MSEEVKPLKKASISKNFIYNFISKILTLIIPFITTPYVARVLHETGNGQISFVTSIIAFFTMLSNLGFSIYGQREIARYQNDREKKSKVFWEIFLERSFFTVMALVVLYSIIASGVFDKNYSILLLIMSIQVISVAFDITFLYMGEENFKTIALRSIFFKLLGLILIFVFVKNESDTWVYALCLSASELASNLLLWLAIFKYVGRARPSIKSMFKLLKPALIIFLPVVVTSVFTTFDKTMIGLLAENADYENGCYEQAYKINSVAQMVTVLFSSVMMSRNTYDYKNGNIEAMNIHVYKSFRYVFMTSFFLCAGFLVLSNSFSAWFLGEGYTSVPALLQIMSIRLIFSGLSIIFGDRFIAMGKEKFWAIAVSVGALVNFGVNWLLIPRYGAVGAAIATAVTEALIFVAFAIMSFGKKRLSGLKVLSLSWKYVLSAALSFVVMFLIQRWLGYSVWEFLVIGFSGTSIYMLALLVLKDEFFIDVFNKTFKYICKIFKKVVNKMGRLIHKLKEWRSGGVLFYSVTHYIWRAVRYGKHTAAGIKYYELCNECKRFKIIQNLKKRYKKKALKFKEEIEANDAALPHIQNDTIWIFWWQGIENAPPLVKMCYQSVWDKYGKTHKIVLIEEKNYKDYVEIPSAIQSKLDNKQISVQLFSDFLRLTLLVKYGGTWLDATIFCTEELPEYALSDKLFVYQVLFPSTFGIATRFESWFIHSESNNKFLMLLLKLLEIYIYDHRILGDYLIIFDLVELVIDIYPEEWDNIIPAGNQSVHTLQNVMSRPFDERIFNSILQNSPIHKLNWRRSDMKSEQKDTFYKYLIENYKIYGEDLKSEAQTDFATD